MCYSMVFWVFRLKVSFGVLVGKFFGDGEVVGYGDFVFGDYGGYGFSWCVIGYLGCDVCVVKEIE